MERAVNSMKVWIIRRNTLLRIGAVFIFGLFLLAGTMGAGAVIEANASAKELPIYCVETPNQEKKLALGINCAWGDEDIPKILDELDQYQVKATFFVVGEWCDAHPQSVSLIAKRGHEVGSHSDTHPDLPSLSEEEIRKEIQVSGQKIETLTGVRPTLFRCPSGSYDDRSIRLIREEGYYPIQWSLDSLDWKGTNEQEMIQRIVPKLTYGDILLFHNDTDYTAEALPGVIQAIQQQGYEFVTVGELIHQGDYTVDVTGRQFPG